MRDQSPILPASVTVYFQADECTPTTADAVESTWTIDHFVDPETGPAGHPGRKIFRDTATDSDDLSRRIAADFYGWRMVSYDRVYNRIIDFELEAQTDTVEWSYRAHECTTRVRTAPYNGDPEELQHALAGGCVDTGGFVAYVPPATVEDGKLHLPKAAITMRNGRLFSYPVGEDVLSC